MEILIATTNQGKKQHMIEGFKDLKDIEFLSLIDFPPVDDVEETGTTFEQNALQKAQYYAQKFNIPTLGEDSGILVDAFPQKFGIKTRREFGENVSDMEWLTQFLELLKDQTNRKALFVSTITYYDPQTETRHTVQGQISGIITEFPQIPIQKGIPASSIFIPEGSDVVHGAMTKAQKNKFSHRGIACQKMAEFLQKL
jgi:XTP/dITP diphosphohydrolase